MPLTRRYIPEHAPGEVCTYGMDFSYVIPPGVGITMGVVQIFTNTVPPVLAPDMVVNGPIGVRGRVVYASLSGGTVGTDYQLRWTVSDTDGNLWPRTGLVLCAPTS
jgi:hypothetical protein